MTRFAASAVRNWHGTGFSPVSFMNNDAKAQQEVFSLSSAGKRFPVVFSHFLLTYSNNNNTRKGAFNQLSHSAHDGLVRRDSTISTQEVQQISFLSSGRPASVSTKSTNNSFFTFFTNHK